MFTRTPKSHRAGLPHGATRRAVRPALAGTVLLSTALAGIQPALAAELVTAELVGTRNVIQVEQGRTADFTINLTATDKAACGSTHTATVKNAYSISGTTLSTGTTFSDVVSFSAPGTGTNCDIAGGGTVPARISAAANTPVGAYTATLSTDAGTTQVSSSNNTGGKLADATATTLTFHVVAPANTAPARGNAPADATGAEGSTLTTSGSFTDVDGNLSSIAVTSGAGSVTAHRTADGRLTGSWSWNLATTDQVSGSVTVTATDAGGLTGTQTFGYTATNVAPRVAVAASDATGNEGQTLLAGGTFADVSGDRLTITKVSGAGDVVDHGDGTWSWSLATTDETGGTVTVQADDGDGGTQTDSFQYTAHNVAPGVRTPAVDAVGDEGSTLSAAGAFSDVPADTLTISHAGDGDLVDGADGTWSWTLAALDDGSGTVTVTASDGRDSTADDFTYTVRNVAPAVAVPSNDVTGDEGTTLRGGGKFSDVAADALTITKVSGPGTVVGSTDGTWTWSYDSTDDLTADVVVKAVDGDGGEQTDTFSVTVRNAAPVVAPAAADATGSEGNTLVTNGRFSDVPADQLTITHRGAGTLEVGPGGTWSWRLETTDQTSGTVAVTARDDDGGTVTDTFDYSAVNVAPVLSTLSVAGGTGTACLAGNVVQLAFSIDDPAAADTMRGTISWGDGQTTAFTERTVDVSHTYAAGTYTITVNVSDDDGGAATARSASVSRTYAVGAVQAPFNADGTSVFKHGSVAPVKVRITDCAGSPVSGLAPTIKVEKVSSATPTTLINETGTSVSAADTTGVLRYDAASGSYIYNLSTKSLSDGDAKYVVTVAEGTSKVSQNFGLRTK